MVDTATQVPESVFAGDLIAWERELADYPASAWELTYSLSNAADRIEIVAGESGDTYTVSIDVATSGAYKAGRYRWFARVSDGAGDERTVEQGWIVILPDPAKQADWRSHARKMLDAIEAALEGAADKDQLNLLSYSLGVVSVSRDRELLWTARARYQRELKNEEGSSKKNQRHTFVRFTPP